MTKTMGLMALGLSMALLSGCGSSDDIVDNIVDNTVDDIVSDTSDSLLNTPTVVEKNIIGDWLNACEPTDDGGSEIDRVIFETASTGEYKGAEFSAPGCNDADTIESWQGRFTYTIGDATSGSNGEDAIEVNLVLLDEGNAAYYTMLHFTTVDKFNMATSEDGDTNDGKTPDTRENVFSSSYTYIRQ